ncbi:MAG: serine hydrolase domain-containing protein [Pseudomonadota bacterium]
MMIRLVTICCALAVSSLAHTLTLDPEEVANWAAEYFEPRIEAGMFNGASVGVVQNGETILLKGFGWQDQAKQIPIDPQITRFRMCSVSKTLTATAILQLRDRGLIDSLDDPVNKYLKRYQLPGAWGAEVTLRQLMTHSSGMAGHFTPQGTKLDIKAPVSQAEVESMFRENIQRPPGAIGQYANLGVALESVVIEDLSGLSMADYVAANILQPLEMQDSLLHHEPEPPVNLAQPYGAFPNGELQVVRFLPKHPLTAASGGLIATPRDMLKYAAFHADVTSPALTDVLSNEAQREMQQRQMANHPAGDGIGLHFYPRTYGGTLYVSHGCGLPGTSSQLGVFPEYNAAIVISVLRATATPSVGDLIKQAFDKGRMVAQKPEPTSALSRSAPWTDFLQRFAGPAELRPVDPELAGPSTAAIAGTYWVERRSFTSISTLFAAGSVRNVTVESPDTIKVGSTTATRVAPGVYDTDQQRRYIFRNVDDEIYLHTNPSSAWRKVSGMGNPELASMGLTVGLALFVTLVLVPLWPKATNMQRRIRWLGWAILGSLLALPITLFAGYETVADVAMIDVSNGDLTRLVIVVLLINLIGLAGLGLVAATFHAWSTELGPRIWFWRIHLLLLAFGVIATWPAYLLFNMIGMNI